MEPNEMFKFLNNVPVEVVIVKENKSILPVVLIGLSLVVTGYLLYKKVNELNELKKE
jgi:hypothetical protein